MTKQLLDSYGWQMSHWRLKEALGFKGNWKMPSDFTLPITMVGDTQVYITASKQPRWGHRVMAICNDCGKHVPAGRMHQHKKIHD